MQIQKYTMMWTNGHQFRLEINVDHGKKTFYCRCRVYVAFDQTSHVRDTTQYNDNLIMLAPFKR